MNTDDIVTAMGGAGEMPKFKSGFSLLEQIELLMQQIADMKEIFWVSLEDYEMVSSFVADYGVPHVTVAWSAGVTPGTVLIVKEKTLRDVFGLHADN